MNIPGLLTAALLLALWEAAIALSVVDYEYLPAPSAVLKAGTELAGAGELLPRLGHTVGITLLGWTIASVIGGALGLLLGLSERTRRWSMQSLEVIKGVPPITLVPVSLMIFGFSARMELSLIVFAAVWPVLINSIGGLRSLPSEMSDLASMFRFPRLRSVAKIYLPGAIPSMLVGLRLGLSLSLVLAVVAELVGNPAGLGNAIIRAQQSLQPEKMFAYFFTVGLSGLGLNAAFRIVSSWILRGRTAPGEGVE